jgi:hypothetical protein
MDYPKLDIIYTFVYLNMIMYLVIYKYYGLFGAKHKKTLKSSSEEINQS